MWCFKRNRSVKFKITKTVVIILFILAGSQFFNLSLTFTRGASKAILGDDKIPEPIPKKKSFFGIDLIQFDNKAGPKGEIPAYIVRAAIAGVMAIALAIVGMTGICNDSFCMVSAFSIAMTILVILTGTLVMIFGSKYDANLPIIVCACISIVTIVFSIAIKREKYGR